MNLSIEIDTDLTDHLKKCRCCFRSLEYDTNFARIDDEVQMQFFELTQISVR